MRSAPLDAILDDRRALRGVVEIEHRRSLPGPPERAFALIGDLQEYLQWMDLVHEVTCDGSVDGQRAWQVELQARVGPFARSKRLRMVRVVYEPPHEVVFERGELDERDHSPWVLRATLSSEVDGEVELAMTLSYGGSLWTGAVLARVLDDHVERGAEALRVLLGAPGPSS